MRRGLPHLLLNAATAMLLLLGSSGACIETTSTLSPSPDSVNKVRADTARSRLFDLHRQGFWPADSTGWVANERDVIAAVLPVMRSTLGPRPNELLPLYRLSRAAAGFVVDVACFERLPDGGLLSPFNVISFAVSHDLKVVRPLPGV